MRGRINGIFLLSTWLLAATLLIAHQGLLGGTAQARKRYVVKTSRVKPGLTRLQILDRRGPNRINVLRVDPALMTIDVALGTEVLPGHETTSSTARRHNAIAATNGDYTIRPTEAGAGRPIHLFMEDGEVKASPLLWGRNIGFSGLDDRVYIGHPPLRMTLRQRDTNAMWRLKSLNAWHPLPDEYAVYTPAGGSVFTPPRDACSVRMYPLRKRRWMQGEIGVERDYLVDRIKCGPTRLAPEGGVVVSALSGTEKAAQIVQNLLPGEEVTLAWETGWRGVLDAVGGNPDLLENGVIVTDDCGSFCQRHPRTGAGVTPGGDILLVTVDGRRPRYSVGMTPEEFARLFRYLGANWAINLDGGGATTMVVKGNVVNRPSDGRERAVGSSILVLDHPDPQQRLPAPYSPLSQLAPGVPHDFTRAARRYCRSLRDPASIGGLLDALDRGHFGGLRRPLARPLRYALRGFRSETSCSRRSRIGPGG